ncbi:MAG: roadblock/LC7 domain-containing protein [candidate division WOR-3 bacterium]
MGNIILLTESEKRIENYLEEILIKTGAQQIFLAAKSGEVLVFSGAKPKKKLDSITALLVGAFNATEKLAELINETYFTQFFIKGKKWNVLYHNIESQFLLVALFKEETLLGPVRVLLEELVPKLKEELAISKKEKPFKFEKLDGEKLMEELFKK